MTRSNAHQVIVHACARQGRGVNTPLTLTTRLLNSVQAALERDGPSAEEPHNFLVAAAAVSVLVPPPKIISRGSGGGTAARRTTQHCCGSSSSNSSNILDRRAAGGVRIDGRGGHGGIIAGILLAGGLGDRLQWRIVLRSPLSATMCDDM